MTIQEIRNLELPALTPLQKTMIRKAMPILDHQDVHRYKIDAQLRLARRERRVALRLPVLFIAIALLSAATCVYTHAYLALGGAVAFFLSGFFMMNAILRRSLRGPFWAAWNRTHWRDFTHMPWQGRMPPVMKRRAFLVEQACPEAEVFVEYLADDPFLLVVSPEGQYYIGVWDEEGFR